MDSRAGILFPLLLIAAVAVIALSAMGMATMLGWMPEAVSATAPVTRAAAPGAALVDLREDGSCVECGRVEAVDAGAIRVRMNDGSHRTIRYAAPPALSIGQKVRVTDTGVAAAG